MWRSRILLMAMLMVSAGTARPTYAFPLVVQSGDTLAGIAQRIYGRVENEGLLVSANGLDVGSGIAIVPGMRLEVPAAAYRRTSYGDTWPALATVLLGAPNRAAVLAFANDSKPWLLPTDNAEILIPYNLRYVAAGGETLVDVAERFLHNKKRAWMLAEYNGTQDVLLRPGQVVLVPLTELQLTDAGRDAAHHALEGTGEAARERRAQQLAAAEEIPALLGDVRAGRYAEVIARGVSLLAGSALTTPQRASVQRQLLEAYTALGATGRAIDACREWRKAAPRVQLDPVELSPKLLGACRAPASSAPPTGGGQTE
jgi:LysM domain-containing protein